MKTCEKCICFVPYEKPTSNATGECSCPIPASVSVDGQYDVGGEQDVAEACLCYREWESKPMGNVPERHSRNLPQRK
jgi:hypothetical protein